jgi:hypothetical protein
MRPLKSISFSEGEMSVARSLYSNGLHDLSSGPFFAHFGELPCISIFMNGLHRIWATNQGISRLSAVFPMITCIKPQNLEGQGLCKSEGAVFEQVIPRISNQSTEELKRRS